MQAAAKTSAAHELSLTGPELRYLIRSTFSKYAVYVFKIIRAMELEGYYPAQTEREAAYSKLCKILGCNEFAYQVLRYHTGAERRRQIHVSAEDDKHFLEASEVLRGYSVAPLIADLEYQTAYTLWSRAGSWTGAMELLGLDLLQGRELEEAVRRYAIGHISPELLPKKMKDKLSKKQYALLINACSVMCETGRYPPQELAREIRNTFMQGNYSAERIFEHLGAPLPDDEDDEWMQDYERKIRLEHWRASSNWWRKPDKKRKSGENRAQLCQIDTEAQQMVKADGQE